MRHHIAKASTGNERTTDRHKERLHPLLGLVHATFSQLRDWPHAQQTLPHNDETMKSKRSSTAALDWVGKDELLKALSCIAMYKLSI